MNIRQPLAFLVVTAALSTMSGCGGTSRTLEEGFPSARDWFEQRSAVVAVVPDDFVPFLSLSYSEPRTASETTPAAAELSVVSVDGCGADANTACSESVLAAPIGAVVDSILGPETLESWPGLEKAAMRGATDLLRHGLEDRRPQLLLGRAVVARIEVRTDHDARLTPVRGDLESFVPGKILDGLIEVRLTRFGLLVEGAPDQTDEDPNVALKLEVRASFYGVQEIRLAPRASGAWAYVGSPQKLSRLMAENGRLLNLEMEQAADAIARRVVN